MDYLKTVVPSQMISERGSKLVVINPGSDNIRIGLAKHENPISVPHCIAHFTQQVPRQNVQDQMLNSQVTTVQHMEREKAYNVIASSLKIPFLDEEFSSNSASRKMGRIDGSNPRNTRKDVPFTCTAVYDKNPDATLVSEKSMNQGIGNGSSTHTEVTDSKESNEIRPKYRNFIFGEEALRISPAEPYCLRRPIRRGRFNVSQHYPAQQVYEDLHAIWDWILAEKLEIHHHERTLYSAVLVVPETFDSREIKETLSIVLQELRFSSAVVHQEGLAAVFGNGLPTTCIVNIGAQVTSILCVEDGVTLPHTQKILPFGGEDISRCLLWTQRHHQMWPQIRTDILGRPVDLLMLNRLKESYCEIKEGELDAIATVHSYEDGMPAGSHKTRLTALNVPPMGLFYPNLLVPDVYPPPPRTWFQDHENMLEDSWQMDFPGAGLPIWDSYPLFPAKPKKEEKIGIAEAVTSSILSTGRIDLQRKLFSSIQLIGGVASTSGLLSALEERVLYSIPSTLAIDAVEVLQLRSEPITICWKGGSLLGILDFGREAWIHREDWVRNGIHIGSGRKYKDSYYLQAQAMCYINQ